VDDNREEQHLTIIKNLPSPDGKETTGRGGIKKLSRSRVLLRGGHGEYIIKES